MPDLETGRRRCADFQQRWRAFVVRWERADRADPARARRLVQGALVDGLAAPPQQQQKRPDRGAFLRCAMAVVRESGAFDEGGYVEANRLSTRRVDPLLHFVDEGWRDLRAPSLDFDLWWYWCSYLDPTAEDVNPLLHHLLVGKHEGLDTVPDPPQVRVPTQYEPGQAPRRACLFAAYDRDGVVDDYVVDYVRELARHADVFYLADGVLDSGELDKLEGIARGAWTMPHAAYDFGSWSLLARDLVGWQRLEEYDEVVLVNDSCFLVRPLDEVFAEMDRRPGDWWSLQATSMEFNEDDVGEDASMPLEVAKRDLVGPRRWVEVDYLHLSSYFQVLRRPVLDDEGFRFRLDTVCGQRTKQLVVDKYEIGISRYLMDSGFEFDTWAPDLRPFHPLYSRRSFDLIGAGFPLVKRNFLAENPRDVPGFAAWPEWLRDAAPEAPMDLILASIARVSPDDRIQRGLSVGQDERSGRRRPQRPLGPYAFRSMAEKQPKLAHWWAFPVTPDGHRLDPGARALFEAVRQDPTIRKVVLTRSRRFDVDGKNVVAVPIDSRDGQEQLARCREIFVDRPPRAALGLSLAKGVHQLVHVGSGVPIGEGGLAALDRGSQAFRDAAADYRRLNAMVVASQADALAKAAATPLNLHQLWMTGLPRHDLVTSRHDALPVDLRQAEQELRDRLGDRRLVVLWPRPGRSPNTFSDSEREWLASWCQRQDAVLGVRESQVDRPGSLTQTLTPLGAWGLSARRVPDPSVVLRVADAVVTDGADDAVDFLLTGRPLLVLKPEEESGEAAGHYPAASVLPGPVCRTFAELEAALEAVFDPPSPGQVTAYERAVDLAFAHTDDLSAWRVVERIRRQYLDF